METISNIIPYFKEKLNGVADEREIISWAYLSIKHLFGYNRSDCIINQNKELSQELVKRIKIIVLSLENNKPLQYILGETEFYGTTIKVNHYTLIPRPETEELVDWILKEDFSSVLDIGTGSGCIAICLAKNTRAKISGIDISENALEIAKRNAEINGVHVNFIQEDILETSSLDKVDIIVSNPPYILDSESHYMKANILKYEPHLALFVADTDPLLFYNRIGALATKSLNPDGKLFFEVNERYASQIVKNLNSMGFVDIALKKDINEKYRMIKAIWK